MPAERTPGAPSGSQTATPRSAASKWTPPIVWTAIILIGTSWPSISVGPDVIIGFDKVVHFGMYGVLAVLVMRALGTASSLRAAVLVVLALSAFGAADEWHQGFINGRSASLYDWIADSLGACCGVLASRLSRPAAASTLANRSSHP